MAGVVDRFLLNWDLNDQKSDLESGRGMFLFFPVGSYGVGEQNGFLI